MSWANSEPTLEVDAWPGDQQHHQKIMGRDGEKNSPGAERAYPKIGYTWRKRSLKRGDKEWQESG